MQYQQPDPDGLIPVRCECGKLLGRMRLFAGFVEFRCKNCGRTMLIRTFKNSVRVEVHTKEHSKDPFLLLNGNGRPAQAEA